MIDRSGAIELRGNKPEFAFLKNLTN